MTVPERARKWRKASRSGQTSDCVEVALDGIPVNPVGVRDSKDPHGGELAVSGDVWRHALTVFSRE